MPQMKYALWLSWAFFIPVRARESHGRTWSELPPLKLVKDGSGSGGDGSGDSFLTDDLGDRVEVEGYPDGEGGVDEGEGSMWGYL
jgi:hypothetical protein